MAEKARNQSKHIDNFEVDPEILRMAAQVSDVLPYVPRHIIVANLSESTYKLLNCLIYIYKKKNQNL